MNRAVKSIARDAVLYVALFAASSGATYAGTSVLSPYFSTDTTITGVPSTATLKNKNGDPVLTYVTGMNVKAKGGLLGLGIVLSPGWNFTLTGNVSGETACVNPAGKIAPGKSSVSFSKNWTFSILDIFKLLSFDLLGSETFAQPSAKAAGCPSDNWTAYIKSIKFTLLQIQADGNSSNKFYSLFYTK
jgi:hypothetical protein